MADPAVTRAAQNLRRLRAAAGLSQEALAKRAGMSQSYLSDLERANRQFTLPAIVQLCSALNCEIMDLLEGIQTNPG